MPAPNSSVAAFVAEIAALCKPAAIHWCDGSEAEYSALCARLVSEGTLIPLNPAKRPNSYLARSTPDDVARLEHRTFICTTDAAEAGPTNNWREPVAMRAELNTLLDGAMAGRTLYVLPFVMASGTPIEMFGVQVTDSAYVAASMHIMTRMGADVLARMEGKPFVRCVHSVGAPLAQGETSSSWPSNPTHKYIAHFPETAEIMSFGSGYGGNALLGKKCLALRLASVEAHKSGWLAEHMLIVGLESPEGEKAYVAGAFPSACGKTNFAMVEPPEDMKGWTVSTVGDDIAWLFAGPRGELRAVNPEAGFFGVAPGTSAKTNPVAMDMVGHDCIFTNCALTEDGDVWWEGMGTPPDRLIDWQGRPWTPDAGRPAAHPNARFTVRATNCRTLDANWNAPEGVEISALLFGGRLSKTFPLVFEAQDWAEGVLWAATLSSEATAAAEGQADIRRDPFAMLPFCGYNIADYMAHWLAFKDKLTVDVPIFRVNWFRKDENGRFIWPGFRENTRVLRWVVERARGRVEARSGLLGGLPRHEDLVNGSGSIDAARFDILMASDPDEIRAELEGQKRHLAGMGEALDGPFAPSYRHIHDRLDAAAATRH
ncbi:phosphoenolpyruvate carboxykinase (GTP) [Devosia enhydra]|uniref:Phosphoenolpyruvate carboxykinase [GTP] n=1 Tax=Devosia enhydra TaxID=665118 RepID=A0A1K2I2W1_9HYPH|nr:phosphoenolpyruvate carboxykinase (GTP) [Devosia enhydra]SFZ86563.1 phosphoenolpyruvate carboxykinase (GTP) [Devosia enhydra]